jgi:ribonuclease P protein component
MTDQRFRPHERVRHATDYERAYALRRAVSDGIIILHVAPNQLEHARLGISVPRRRIPRAVQRNRFKRLVREAFRLSKCELPTGYDLIVIPRGVPCTVSEIRASLIRLAREGIARLQHRAQAAARPGPSAPRDRAAPKPKRP